MLSTLSGGLHTHPHVFAAKIRASSRQARISCFKPASAEQIVKSIDLPA